MKKLLSVLIILLLLAILTPLAIIFFRPNLILNKEQVKQELALPSSHFIHWRGAEIHYVDEGSGYPVLMIHGFGGSYRNFSKLADLLKDQYRIIRIDLPGFGMSDLPVVKEEHPDYVQLYRDYMSFILDTLHLDSVYVIGNSMGGGIAWLTAVDHPGQVKKLVLLNSAGYDIANVSGKLIMFRYNAIGHIFDKGMPVFMSRSGIEKCYAEPSKLEPEVWEKNNELTNREGNIQCMLILARAHEFPDSTLIKKVECPTLIVWGKQDAIIPVEHAEKFHRDIENSRVIIYDSCGHVPMMEKAEDVKRDFIAFVKE